ncbi:uncharacterized protein LOC127283608 [Leptopilina boulardi]|uniref:uncharacterized protein LOC127283608 n=1 Tax=Leptopilina boulardi TaxID=63433 RepID=UPI0021F63489|nr:uncharacterized protein LOC127283608 [Leptopilina boulardi]
MSDENRFILTEVTDDNGNNIINEENNSLYRVYGNGVDNLAYLSATEIEELTNASIDDSDNDNIEHQIDDQIPEPYAGSSGSTKGESAKRTSGTWKDKEVEALIDSYKEVTEASRSAEIGTPNFWKKVSVFLATKNIQKSLIEYREKFKSLDRTYKNNFKKKFNGRRSYKLGIF